MDEHQPIPTTAPSPALDVARTALAAVLVGDPDFETTVAASEAVLILSDVHPPLPPLDYPDAGVDAAEGIAAAVRALDQAVDEAPTAAEALRAAHAVRCLRQLLDAAQGPAVPGAPLLP